MESFTTLSDLHTIMVNIDESELVDESSVDLGIEPDYDEEANHSLDGNDDWLDSPKASEIGLSKDFPKDGPTNQQWKGDPMYDSKDPWGIGEGESDANVPDDIQISQGEEDFGPPDDIQLNERDVREITNKVWESMDDGMMDPRDVANAALKYMSEDDVADMARSNEWLFLFTDDDEYDEDDDEGDDFALSSTDWNEE